MATTSSLDAGRPSSIVMPEELRRQFYETMVLARSYEEAIRSEYHADKGPGFDIGKASCPARSGFVTRMQWPLSTLRKSDVCASLGWRGSWLVSTSTPR